MTRSILIITFLFALTCSYAQENRYVVYFSDKNNSNHSVDNPLEFLSQRAINRRQHQDIDITIQDLPVNPWYLDSLRLKGVDVFYTSRWFNAAVVQATPDEIEQLNTISVVDFIDYAAPNIKLINSERKGLNYKTTIESSFRDSLHNITEMHNEGFKGQGLWVAVMDAGFSGVDQLEAFNHLFTENKLVMVKNLVNNNESVYQFSDHGTMVLSLISAFFPDQFTGVAPEATIGLFVTEEMATEYRIEEYNWLIAAEMADSAGFDIINTSLGYSTFDDPAMNYTYSDMDGQTTVISRASNYASERGIVCITSAGNEGNKDWEYITAPGDAINNITVGAVNGSFVRAGFSSIGPTADGRLKPELAAWGTGVDVIAGNGTIQNINGTSLSTPIVTGLAAGIWERFPHLTAEGLRNKLIEWTTHPESPDNLTGHGTLIYNGANFITGTKELDEAIHFYPNPAKNKLYYHNLISIEVEFIDIHGRRFIKKPEAGEIDLSGLSSGIYMMIIITGDVQIKYKLIKE